MKVEFQVDNEWHDGHRGAIGVQLTGPNDCIWRNAVTYPHNDPSKSVAALRMLADILERNLQESGALANTTSPTTPAL